MIWGKTYSEKIKARTRKNLAWFAWRPVRLHSGRMAWLQKVKREICKGGRGSRWFIYEEIL